MHTLFQFLSAKSAGISLFFFVLRLGAAVVEYAPTFGSVSSLLRQSPEQLCILSMHLSGRSAFDSMGLKWLHLAAIMKYIVFSQVKQDIDALGARFLRFPWGRQLWRSVSGILLVVSYLGMLISPAVVLDLPFNHAGHRLPPTYYWAMGVLEGLVVAWLLYRSLVYGYHCFRRGIIHVEAIVLALGLFLAVAIIPWIEHLF